MDIFLYPTQNETHIESLGRWTEGGYQDLDSGKIDALFICQALVDFYFWNFPFNIFRLELHVVTETTETVAMGRVEEAHTQYITPC